MYKKYLFIFLFFCFILWFGQRFLLNQIKNIFYTVVGMKKIYSLYVIPCIQSQTDSKNISPQFFPKGPNQNIDKN